MANGPVPGPNLVGRISDALGGVKAAVGIAAALVTLVVWAVRQEGRIVALEKEIQAEHARLTDFDQRGTMALSERVAKLNELGALLNQHLNAVDVRENQRDVHEQQVDAELDKRLRVLEDQRRQTDVVIARQEEAYRRFTTFEQKLDQFSREFNRAMDGFKPPNQPQP